MSDLASPPTGTPRRRFAAFGTIVGIAVIMVLGSFAGITFSSGASTVASGAHADSTPHAAGRAVTTPVAAPSSGNGTFWLNTAMQNVSTNTSVCSGPSYFYYPPKPLCGVTNITNEPAINLSSNGVLFTAYTAYTNWTPCEEQGFPLLANYTFTEIGVTTSTNGGATWSTPQYLGNTVCNNATNADNYVNSWQPTVTSLANGTLVAAWVEFNVSTCTYCDVTFPELSFQEDDYNSSQLVVAFSYDNGTNWTEPTAVNTSTFGGSYCAYYCRTYANWLDQRPSMTAFGQTIYLTWTNITEAWYGYDGDEYECTMYGFDCPAAEGDSAVQLAVSLNGTSNFSAPIQLPVESTPGAGPWVAANPSALVTPYGTLVVAYMSNLTWNSTLPLREGCYNEYPYYSDCGGFISDVEVGQSSDNGTNWTVGVAASHVYDARDYSDYIDQQEMISPSDQINPAPKATYDPVSQQVVIAYIGDVEFQNCIFPYGNICDPPYDTGQFTMPDVWAANGSLATNNWTSRLVTAWSGLANSSINGLQDSYFFNPAIVSTANGTIYLSAQFVNGSACTNVPAGSYLFRSAIDYCGEGLEIFGISNDNGTSFTTPGDVDSTGEWYNEMPAGLQSSMIAHGNQVWIAWTQTTCPTWETANRSGCEWGDVEYTGAGYAVDYTSNTTVIVSRLFVGMGVTVSFQETGLPVGASWSVDFSGDVRSGLAGTPLSVGNVPVGANETWNGSIILIGPGARYFGTPSISSPGNFTANTTITWTYFKQYTLTISDIPDYPNAGGGLVWFETGYECSEEYYNEYAFDPSGTCSEATSINYNLTPGPSTIWADAGTPFRIQVQPLNGSQFWSEFFCTGCDWDYVNLSFEAWTGTGVGSYNGTSDSTVITLGGPVNETASFGINGYCVWRDTPAWVSDCASSGLTVQFQQNGLPIGDKWGVSVWSTGLNQTTPYPSFTTANVMNVLDPTLTSLAYFQPYTVPSSTSGDVWVATADPGSPLLGPLDGSSVLHYSLQTATSTLFTSTVREEGLPNASAWSYSVDGIGTGVQAASANATFNGGSHTFSASPVYLDNGVGYTASAIDIQPFVVNETWTNATGASTTYTFDGPASVTVVYTPIYELTAQGSTGGSITDSGTSWVASGGKVTLNATADTGFHFIGWSGTGNSSVTASTTEINVTLTSPDAEYATFAPNATAVYVVTVQATGLTNGGTYSVVFNGTTYSGSGTFALPAYLGGDYTISVPIAYDNTSSLVRFWPETFTSTLGSGPGGTYDLSGNGGMINIVFATQYALEVSESGSGSVNPTTGTYWETSGNQTTLTATPNAEYVFDGWSGTGAGSMNATTSTVVVTTTAPIAEAAVFSAFVPRLPATYVLTVTETGLPSGTSWSFSDGVTGWGSTTGIGTLDGLNGTYTLTVPAVRIGSSEQFLPSTPSQPVTLTTQNQTVTVAFSGQYMLTVVAGAGGTVTPGSEWVAQGASVALSATPTSGYTFDGWVGTGVGNYTGTSAAGSVEMSGAVMETGQFTQNSPSTGPVHTQGNSNSLPSYLPWAALAALLVVGLLGGYLVSRPRGGGSAPSPPPPEAPMGATVGGDSPEAAPASPAEYDETTP